MLLPWQHSHVHTYHLIPINTTFCWSWHITQSCVSAQPNSWRPFVVSAAWLQFGNFLNSKPIIPPDSNTQRRLHYFASHNMQWTRPSFIFFALLDTKSSGRPASVRSGPFCSTQQCQTHPALSPLLICCPVLSVFQQ